MNDPVEMSEADWVAEGKRLFGDDQLKWRFVCPICGNVQSPEEFRQYKDLGAQPDSAYTNCIGRYTENPRRAFGGSGKGPCDYAGYGLFKVSPVIVTQESGREVRAFDFDRGGGANG